MDFICFWFGLFGVGFGVVVCVLVVFGSTLASLQERGFLNTVPVCVLRKTVVMIHIELKQCEWSRLGIACSVSSGGNMS